MSTNVAISPLNAKFKGVPPIKLEDSLKFSKKNFLNLKYEIARLQKERLEDLIKISQLQDQVIELYTRINADSQISPLSIAR